MIISVMSGAKKASGRILLSAAVGMAVPGPKDGEGPVFVEFVVVLRWNDAADDDGHAFVAEFRERLAECGHQGQVTGGKRTWSDDIDVIVDCLARGLFRRLKQRAKDHVESEIRRISSRRTCG